MRKNFNFKADWTLAVANLDMQFRLQVYSIIMYMGFHDVDLAEAMADLAFDITDARCLELLTGVEKVLRRRRRARVRAALRRQASRQIAPPPSANVPAAHDAAVEVSPSRSDTNSAPAEDVRSPRHADVDAAPEHISDDEITTEFYIDEYGYGVEVERGPGYIVKTRSPTSRSR